MTRPTFSRRAIVAAGLAGAAGLSFGAGRARRSASAARSR